MNIKWIYFLLFSLACYKATGQKISRSIPDSAITAAQYHKPKKAVFKTADGIITTGLEGSKWKTDHAVIEFRINGQHSIAWDNGNRDFGGWSVNNRILKFVIFKGEDEFDGSGDDIQYYFIISFDGKKMEYQEFLPGVKNTPILVAVRQTKM